MTTKFSYAPNKYLGNIDLAATEHAIQHAKACWPFEACGAIVNDVFIPFDNVAEDPTRDFQISDPAYFDFYEGGMVECLVHSHIDNNAASVLDQNQQRCTDIPWMIINLRQRSVMDCIVFGESSPPPIYGRPFFFGALDCLTLTRDYILVETGFEIPTPAHEFEFFMRGKSDLETMDLPMAEVHDKSLEKNDIMLYDVGGFGCINHIGVYLGAGEVLHHFLNRVSGSYPVTYGRNSFIKSLRLI